MKDTSFTVGLQNIAPEDVDRVVNIIEDTLASVEAEGFPRVPTPLAVAVVALAPRRRTNPVGILSALIKTGASGILTSCAMLVAGPGIAPPNATCSPSRFSSRSTRRRPPPT